MSDLADLADLADHVAHGTRVSLRHLRDDDFPALHRLAMSTAVRRSWRTRGRYWSPAELEHRIAADPHVALVVTDRLGGPPLGLAELHDVDLVDRRAQLGLMTAPETWASPAAAEAALLFLRYAFATLPIDKVACTVQATNVRAVRGLGRLLTHEGTLRRHLNLDGTWVDLEIFAVWRRDLPVLEQRLGGSVRPPGGVDGGGGG